MEWSTIGKQKKAGFSCCITQRQRQKEMKKKSKYDSI